MSQQNPFCLFHRLWSKAVGTEGYDKEEWKVMETVLVNLGLRPDGQKKDWRIGLSAKAKYRTNEMYYEGPCEILDVLGTGAGGIVCADGVLQLRSRSGRVFLNPASEWVTA